MAFSLFSSNRKIFVFISNNFKKQMKITVQITCAHSHSDTCPPHTLFHFIYSIFNFVEFFSLLNKPSPFCEEISINQISFYCFFALLFFIGVSIRSIPFHGHSLNIYFIFNQLVFWCLKLILRLQRSFEWNSSLVYMTNMISQLLQISHIYHVQFSMSFITTLLIQFYFTFQRNKFLTFFCLKKISFWQWTKKKISNSIPLFFFHSFFFSYMRTQNKSNHINICGIVVRLLLLHILNTHTHILPSNYFLLKCCLHFNFFLIFLLLVWNPLINFLPFFVFYLHINALN